jgi:gamma-glutamyltranspeptidase / glutathione hydrolase
MRLIWFTLVMTLSLPVAESLAGERNPPTAYRTGRSVVMSPNGMVATSHPLAAQIGLDVLKRGGNATDAAIAASAAIGLLEPMSCGVGGDLFAIVWDAKTRTLHGLKMAVRRARPRASCSRSWATRRFPRSAP